MQPRRGSRPGRCSRVRPAVGSGRSPRPARRRPGLRPRTTHRSRRHPSRRAVHSVVARRGPAAVRRGRGTRPCGRPPRTARRAGRVRRTGWRARRSRRSARRGRPPENARATIRASSVACSRITIAAPIRSRCRGRAEPAPDGRGGAGGVEGGHPASARRAIRAAWRKLLDRTGGLLASDSGPEDVVGPRLVEEHERHEDHRHDRHHLST